MSATLVADIEVLHGCSSCCRYRETYVSHCSSCCRYRGPYISTPLVSDIEGLTFVHECSSIADIEDLT